MFHTNLCTEPSVYGVCKVSSRKVLSSAGKDFAVHFDDQRLFPFLPFGEQKPEDVIVFIGQEFRGLVKRPDNQAETVSFYKFFCKQRFRFIEILHPHFFKQQVSKNLNGTIL